MKQTHIAIVGAGSVGSTIAYTLLLNNIRSNITLIDIDTARCSGEILDLTDAIPFCNAASSAIKQGTAKDAQNADIVIIAAGKKQEPNQSRKDLFKDNKNIIESIFKQITPLKTHALVLMVTNPVDLMTYYAQQYSNLPKNQVFGSGTFLDTQRLRNNLSYKLNIAEQSIHAYVLGEHGPTQFAAWSAAHIAGIPIEHYNLSLADLDAIAQQTKNEAAEIIACKGSTYYGIAASVAVLCRTILFDQKRVTPVSCYIKKYEVCLSMPTILGRSGIESILPIPLNASEQEALAHSAQTLKNYID